MYTTVSVYLSTDNNCLILPAYMIYIQFQFKQSDDTCNTNTILLFSKKATLINLS